MSPNELKCLEYLNDKMEANSRIIGNALFEKRLHPSKTAGAIMGRLYKRHLVTYVYDLFAWRITERGRNELRTNKSNNEG